MKKSICLLGVVVTTAIGAIFTTLMQCAEIDEKINKTIDERTEKEF